jgi:maltose O-acetyltransferase
MSMDSVLHFCAELIPTYSFKANNSQTMLDHKLEVRRRLLKLNDDTIPDGWSLNDLKMRRLKEAKQIMGKLGSNTNIEAPLFCTWGCQTFIGKDTYINRK